jgi:hypothetical protein
MGMNVTLVKDLVGEVVFIIRITWKELGKKKKRREIKEMSLINTN